MQAGGAIAGSVSGGGAPLAEVEVCAEATLPEGPERCGSSDGNGQYSVGDELAGKVTKVVTFGAFVEILDGVEGLVHISELAPHHVESPREIVHPGDEIRVKILEIDSERRRLSLSAKRVEDQILPVSRPSEPAQDEAPPAEVAEASPAEEAEAPVAESGEAPAEATAEEPAEATAEAPA